MIRPDAVQEKAISSPARTVLVQGGPGTGKTLLLARRFLHLVREKGILPSKILVLLFSAASIERFRLILEKEARQEHEQASIHTFHSFATSILTNPEMAKEMRHPSFISPFKEYVIMKELLRLHGARLGETYRRVAGKSGFSRELCDFFKLLKQNLLSSDDFSRLTKNLSDELTDLGWLYRAYEDFLTEKNCSGFSDTVFRAVTLLRENDEMARRSQSNYEHILVDEFEEIDPAQFELLKSLLREDTSLFVTGDENQRIYGFRGSGTGRFQSVKLFRRATDDYLLETNYRLPERLRAAASGLIGDARESAIGMRAPEVIKVMKHKDPVEQAYEVAREIKQTVLDEGGGASISYSDFAVLCRSTAGSSLPLEEAFSYYGIPYVLHNSTSFFFHPTVRSLADLLESILAPQNGAALKRALCMPGFQVDPIELARVINDISAPDESMHDYLFRFAQSEGEEHPVKEPLKQALDYMKKKRMRLQEGAALVEVVRECMRELVLAEVLKKDMKSGVREAKNLRLFDRLLDDIESAVRQLNPECALEEIIGHLQHAFAHFSQYQESIPADEVDEGVRIMTAHQAKGLGFPVVHIIDATEDYFPTLRKTAAVLDGKSLRRLSGALKRNFEGLSFSSPYFRFTMTPKEHLDEERQLLYVAMTRASKRLVINYPEESHLGEPVEPSPFIEELVETNGLSIDEAAPRALDIFKRLNSALNQEEIETAVHSLVERSPAAEEMSEVRRRLDEVGLDSQFIFAGNPFEREPAKAPDISRRRFSASQLAQYLSCPRRYFYERILKIAPERPQEFDVGELVHLTLERFHGEARDFQADCGRLEAKIMSVFQKIWIGGEGGEGFSSRFQKTLQREVVRRKVERMLRRYVRTESAHASQSRGSQARAPQARASRTQASHTRVIACEKTLEFTVEGIPFVAKIDRIDSLEGGAGHRIIDYKTSQSGPIGARSIKKLFLNVDEKDEYTPQDFQLPLYLIGARAADYSPVELCYYWLAQENASGMFKKSMLLVGSGKDCLSDEEMETAKKVIAGVANRILAGAFPPEPRSDYDCQRCSFIHVCEE